MRAVIQFCVGLGKLSKEAIDINTVLAANHSYTCRMNALPKAEHHLKTIHVKATVATSILDKVRDMVNGDWPITVRECV